MHLLQTSLANTLFVAFAISQSLPTVNLGYEVHRAIALNTSGGYYNFSNIPYAEPPIGPLRFSKPIPPQQTNNSTINNGSIEHICPQGQPFINAINTQFLEYYIADNTSTFPFAQLNESLYAESTAQLVPPQDPRVSEDCLLLDVMVPQQVFENSTTPTIPKNSSAGLPVLVWIHGGGFGSNSKEEVGNPAGLIKAAFEADGEGVVYVAMNYRLGAFGFLSGPTFEASGGTANNGLYDQRLAFDWVQNYIHLFGGDPKRVTIFGESAGGSSIMFHITAYGGTAGPSPFQQALPMSPWFVSDIPVQQQENAFNEFLALANVSTFEELKQTPIGSLNTANSLAVGFGAYNTPGHYGAFTYAPVVDGEYAPDAPGRLLLEGRFDKSIKVMNGRNAAEGVLFTLPTANTSDAFASLVELWLPSANASTVNYITTTLYPSIFDGSLPYTDNLGRSILFVAEYAITCATNFLDRAFDNQTYGYQFSVPPAFHANDNKYTFYNGPGTNDTYGTYNVTVALAHQQQIVTFAETGVPEGIPIYGNGTILDLNNTGLPFQTIPDPNANDRCLFFQQGDFLNSTTGTYNASVSVYPSNDTSGATNGTTITSGGDGSTSKSLVASEGSLRRVVGSVQTAAGTVLALLAIGAGCLL